MKEEICDIQKIIEGICDKAYEEAKKRVDEGKGEQEITMDNTAAKYHAIMLFEQVDGGFVHTQDMYFNDGTEALWTYAETRCPASQLVSAPTKELLRQEMDQRIEDFKSKEWLDEHIYPYL